MQKLLLILLECGLSTSVDSHDDVDIIMGLELNVALVPNFNIYMIQYYLRCILFIDSDELFLLPKHFPMQRLFPDTKGLFPDAPYVTNRISVV